jgi:hypothetical protein
MAEMRDVSGRAPALDGEAGRRAHAALAQLRAPSKFNAEQAYDRLGELMGVLA